MRDTDGKRIRSSMVNISGRSKRPWIISRCSAGLILGTALFGMFLMLTLYMQQVLGYSPMRTGVAYLAVAGTAIFWSGVSDCMTPGFQ